MEIELKNLEENKNPESIFKKEFNTPLTDNIQKIKEIKFRIGKNFNNHEVKKMSKRKIIIVADHGLHLRPANLLAQCANKYKSEIKVIKEEKGKDPVEVDAKSSIMLLTLAAAKNCKLSIVAEGDDAKEAIEDIITTLSKYGEEKIAEEIKTKIDLEKIDKELIKNKIQLLDGIIKTKKKEFVSRLLKDLEKRMKKPLTEYEFRKLSSELREIYNLKGVRNDILYFLNEKIEEPEMNISIHVEDTTNPKKVIMRINDKDKIVEIEMDKINEELIKEVFLNPLTLPLDKFTNEICTILDDKKHKYEIEWLRYRYAERYAPIFKEFIEAPLTEFYEMLNKVLNARMKYEHHIFFEIEK